MLVCAAGLAGQADGAAARASGAAWFPPSGYFSSPLADLREPRLGAGLIVTDVFAAPGAERPRFQLAGPADASPDVQGVVGLGALVRVWRPVARPEGGVVVGFQAGVHSRFRLEQPSRDNVGTDWMAALPVEAAWGRLSGRLRLVHRSAHLGDELQQGSGARRIEYSHEAVDALLAWRPGRALRVYAGGAFIFRSLTELLPALAARGDDAAVQAGLEAAWPADARGRLMLLAAADWQRAERTGWNDELSAAAGLGAALGGRTFRLLLRHYRGPSTMGEFFLTRESFWGLELTAEP